MPLPTRPPARAPWLPPVTNKRDLPWRNTDDPYKIWVSEVMLQQTQVNTVIPYYLKFIDRYPDINALAASDQQDVLKLWEGLGYYSRARNLHRAAVVVVNNYKAAVPETEAEIRKLPGVGEQLERLVTATAMYRHKPLVLTACRQR